MASAAVTPARAGPSCFVACFSSENRYALLLMNLTNSIRAVIFDLDGTLSPAGEIKEALDRTFDELGAAKLARKDVENLIGRGVRSLVERAVAQVEGGRSSGSIARWSSSRATTRRPWAPTRALSRRDGWHAALR